MVEVYTESIENTLNRIIAEIFPNLRKEMDMQV
jgi:hypothetical protein